MDEREKENDGLDFLSDTPDGGDAGSGNVNQSDMDSLFGFDDDDEEESKPAPSAAADQSSIDAMLGFDDDEEEEAKPVASAVETSAGEEAEDDYIELDIRDLIDYDENDIVAPRQINQEEAREMISARKDLVETRHQEEDDVIELDISDFIDLGDAAAESEKESAKSEDLSDLIETTAKAPAKPAPPAETPAKPASSGQSSVLSQDDIDALISSIGTAEPKPETSAGAGDQKTTGLQMQDQLIPFNPQKETKKFTGRYKLYNFRRPDKLSRDQIRKIKSRFEAIPRYITNYLAKLLHCPAEASLIEVDQKYYGDMFRGKSANMLIGTFDIAPSSYNGIMEFSIHTFYCIIDRMMGGQGTGVTPTRSVTEFEKHLAREIFETALKHHQDVLQKLLNIHFKVEHIDNDTLLIPKTQSENDVMIRLVYNINIDGISGYLNICFPYNLLGPYFGRYAGSQKREEIDEGPSISRETVQRSYGGINVPLSVEFQKKKIRAQDMADMKSGTIIRLDHPVDRELNIVIDGKTKFYGKPGVKGEKMGIKITCALDDEEK